MTIKALLWESVTTRLILVVVLIALAINTWDRSGNAVVWVLLAGTQIPILCWHGWELVLRTWYGRRR